MEMYRENAGRESRGQRCVRVCAIETKMDISQEPICAEIYRENAGRRSPGQRLARACAVKMRMDISQEPCCIKICRGNAISVACDTHLARPAQSKCTTDRKNPSSGHTVWEIIKNRRKPKRSEQL